MTTTRAHRVFSKDLYRQATVSDDDGNTLVNEATTLELAPGQWPSLNAVFEDGAHPWYLMRDRNPDEAGSFMYPDNSGTITLFVIND